MDMTTLAMAKKYTDKVIEESNFITGDQIPEGSLILDKTLTQNGAAADAKATGDRLNDVEYQTVTTDLAYEHKDLPKGEKTVTVSGDGTFGNNVYVVSGEDIIPRKTYNCTFPFNGITISRDNKKYHIEGTATVDGSVCFVEKASTSIFEINEDISGKSFKVLSFCNQYTNRLSLVVRFYDTDKKVVQIYKDDGSLANFISSYMGTDNGYRETAFRIPEGVDIKYIQVYITFKNEVVYNSDFQFYIVETENTQMVMLDSPTATIADESVTNVFTAPYQSTIETKAPIVDYINYMTENAKGDTATYLTPEAFGAIGDGYADDTEAVKTCITKAVETTQAIFMTKKYLISSPIEIYQNGLNLIANDIVYNGTDAAIKIQGSNNTLKIHNLISNGTGIVFTGDGEKHMYYNSVDVNTIECKKHGIVFYFNQKGIAQNNIHFSHIKCNGTGCYGIAYLDHENKSDNSFIGENNFYGGHISHCEWACYRVAGNAKFYGIHIENNVEGGFYIIAGVRIIQPRFAESSRDGSHPFFKFINSGYTKIDSSVPLSINEIDLSENQDYYENASGAQYPAHECRVGIVEIPLITPRTEVGENTGTPVVFTNKAYIWGKYLIMTPHISYRKRVITNILDTRLIDKPKGTYQETWAAAQALSQLPTRFVIDNINAEIYLHASYCAFGFNEFEVEQANGFTCKIYDVHEKLIFDGTKKGDGLYKLNVYKDADICKDRVGTKGLLSLDFIGHYWQITKETTVNDILNALPVWQGGEY